MMYASHLKLYVNSKWIVEEIRFECKQPSNAPHSFTVSARSVEEWTKHFVNLQFKRDSYVASK